MDKKYEEAYIKIETTLCLNSGNIKFNLDDEYHDDCTSIDEMAQCLDTLESSFSYIKMLEQQDLLHTKLWEDLDKAVRIIKRKPLCYSMIRTRPKVKLESYEDYKKFVEGVAPTFTEKEFNTLKSHKLI